MPRARPAPHWMGEDARRSIAASFQHHGQHLVIGLNRDGQGFALIEGFPGDLETDNDGSSLFGSGQQLGFGRKRRLGTFFQSRERLVIAVEIHGRSGFIVEGVAVGGGELRFEGVNPQRFVRRIAQRESDGGQDHVLAGHFGGSDEIDRTRSLRFRSFLESEDSHNDSDGGDADQDNASGRKIALGGSEFVADVKLGNRLGRGWRLAEALVDRTLASGMRMIVDDR